jgi:hypothetical protein
MIKAAKGKLNSKGEITDQIILQEIEKLMKSFVETLD